MDTIHKVPEKHSRWLEKKRSTLMVVASLIATMAFQVGVNPPSGVWQDTSGTHRAGFSIMADNYPSVYTRFVIANTTSFIASLSIILLLISGLPIRRRIFMFILMVIMWIAVTSTSLTFLFAMLALQPNHDSNTLLTVVAFAVLLWIVLMGFLILAHTIRIILKGIRKLRK